MNHDGELLLDERVLPNRSEQCGPVAEFLAKKQAEQEAKTLAEYRTVLRRFLDFLGDGATVGDVDEAAAHRFLNYLKSEGLSQNTLAGYFKALKVFTKWMGRRGWTEGDRFLDVKRPKPVRPKFDTLSQEQKQAIMSSFDGRTFLGSRNLAIFAVFMDTGVRLGELVRIETERVHLKQGLMEVFAPKTDEWRYIPLSPETVDVCQNYLRLRQKLLLTPVRHRHRQTATQESLEAGRQLSPTLFVNVAGAPLTENGITLIVSRLRKRLHEQGVDVHIHPHLFRHNFLTEKALDGENPAIVQRWAGHKSHEMTAYYFGLADQKMAAIRPKRSTLAGLSILSKGKRFGSSANAKPASSQR